MGRQLIIGLILTVLPFTEIRIGLPIIIDYLIKTNQSITPYFLLALTLNILIIPIIYLLLDHVHQRLIKYKNYQKIIDYPLKRIQKKAKKLNQKFHNIGYLALLLFVSIPLPTTGAWSATLISWILNLNRKKSIISISLGVLIASLIILLLSYGFLMF